MDLISLTKNDYILALLGGLIFYLGTVFLFIDKIEEKIKTKHEEHDNNLIKRYKGSLTVKHFIEFFDSLRINRNKLEKPARLIELMHWFGIGYLMGALGGFILQQLSFSQDLAILIMVVSALYFITALVILIFMYRKLK